MKKLVIIQGHPDPVGGHLCHALADAYADGAISAAHEVYRADIARLDFPLLRSQAQWQQGRDTTPLDLREAQQRIVDADHLLWIYPLWMGTMPALLKGFIEQTLRPGVALSYEDGFPKPLFKGKSARIVVTMGMPALAYRWYYRAHSLKSMERSILKLTGISPVRETLFGMVEQASAAKRDKWLTLMRKFGSEAG